MHDLGKTSNRDQQVSLCVETHAKSDFIVLEGGRSAGVEREGAGRHSKARS